MKQRYRSRRLAMQALCCLDVQGEAAINGAQAFIRDTDETPEVIQDAIGMFEAAWEHRAASDALLARHSRHWDLKRMPLVDRGILRLAAWELTAGETLTAAVIDEAIRLAHEFSTADSPRFINGILDAIAREQVEGEGRSNGNDAAE